MSDTPPQAQPHSTSSTSSAASVPAKRQKHSADWPAETPRGIQGDAQFMPTPRAADDTTGQTPTVKGPFSKWSVGEEYTLKKILGQGSYGEVAEAIKADTKRRVAIKRIHNVFDIEIDTKRILREVTILRQLRDDRIVKLLEILPPKDQSNFNELYLVFEFVDTDLHKLIQAPQYLTIEHVRHFLYQLLCAVQYMHSACVIHRDIKPANILLNEDCSLKVCDFGLARMIHGKGKAPVTGDEVGTPGGDAAIKEGTVQGPQPRSLQRQLTKHVVTRWYRPPELILLQEYSTPVDVWSLGCIFAELLSMMKKNVPVFSDRVPLFPGRSCFPLSADSDKTYKDQLDQLNVIFDVIGTPIDEDIRNLGDVQNYLKTLQKKEPKDFKTMFPDTPAEGIDLLRQMLMFNPDKRITVEAALAHPFLRDIRNVGKEHVAPGPIMSVEDLKLNKDELKARLMEEVNRYRKAETL